MAAEVGPLSNDRDFRSNESIGPTFTVSIGISHHGGEAIGTHRAF